MKRRDIDLSELEKLCQLQATDEEIAAWFNVSVRTIERRRLEPSFAEAMHRGKARGRISVRRMQMKLLEQGNATIAVWLGKQLLGQVERAEDRTAFETLAPKQLARAIMSLSHAKLVEILRECGVPMDACYDVIEQDPMPALQSADSSSDS